jgi:oligopeptide transport system substrate-binding protein
MIIDSAVSFQAYKQGELDVVGVAAEDLQAVQSDPVLSQEFLMIPGNCTFYLGFNTLLAPFDNIRVRQAFARAFDREDYVEVVQAGLGEPAYSFIPPDRPGYNADLGQPEFNPEEAKTMLDQVIAEDYPNGFPEIKLTFSSSPRNQVRFEWFQNQIKTNLGIDAELEPVESRAYTELVKTPETTPQFFFLGWCQDYPDPQNWLSLVFHSSSTITHVGWANDEFDALTEEADALTDQAARLDLYNQAHEILLEEVPVVMFYQNVAPVLIKPYITGMREFAAPTDATIIGFNNIENIDINRP